MKQSFKNKIVLLGCGSVSRCLQDLLYRHLDIDWSKLTLLDALPQSPNDNTLLAKGAVFKQERLEKNNFAEKLSKYLSPGDLLIDLSGGVGSVDLLEWCHDHDVNYANTSLEIWQKKEEFELADPMTDTIFYRYAQLYKRAASWKRNSSTAVIEHGANPGLVSHWVKYGLEYLARRIDSRPLREALAAGDYASMARYSGTRVIHISERDTQVERISRQPSEFLNTWSPAGLREESLAFSECTWGVHESELPPDAMHLDFEGKFHLCIKRPAVFTPIRSWVPDSPIIGMLIPHGETFTIGNRLTVVESGKLIYRPTICFVYRPSPQALESLLEFRSGKLDSYIDRLISCNVLSGADNLGALIMGEHGSFWFGSRLSIEQTRAFLGQRHNATVLQVASSLLGAVFWIMKNPKRGLCLPGDLPSQEVLDVAAMYLGQPELHESNWAPISPGPDGQLEKFTHQFHQFMVPDETVDPLLTHCNRSKFSPLTRKQMIF